MKKFFYSLLAVAAISVVTVSCSGKKDQASSVSEMTSKIENCTNPDSLKAYVSEAEQYVQKLVAEGKVDKAKEYLDKIEPVVKEKAPALAATFDSVKSLVDKVPSSASEAADQAKEQANDAVDQAKEQGAAAVDSAKSAISDAADATKAKAEAAVSDAADKVSDAAQNVADKATDAAKDAASKVTNLVK